MSLTWSLKPFTALSLTELYALLRLRSEIFVVEQSCAFQDIDNQDQQASHLLGHTEKGELAAYARLFDAGISYEQASIGRVVVGAEFRQYGFGRELMRQAILQIETQFGAQPIQIGAQQYLEKFYQSFGFQQIGEPYVEDGIPHLHMLRL